MYSKHRKHKRIELFRWIKILAMASLTVSLYVINLYANEPISEDKQWIVYGQHIKKEEVTFNKLKPDGFKLSAFVNRGLPSTISLVGAVSKEHKQKDVLIEADINLEKDNYAMLVVRFDYEKKRCYAFLAHPDGKVGIARVTNGFPRILVSRKLDNSIQRVKVKFQINGENMCSWGKAHTDNDRTLNIPKIKITDDTYPEGGVGIGIGTTQSIFSTQSIASSFYDIKITPLPMPVAMDTRSKNVNDS